MPRAKVSRKSTAIDMTAMCDVAFLLLTFFILSAKPKVEDPIHADIPASTTIQALPEVDFAQLLVAQGKVIFSVEGADVRLETLKGMADQYKIDFTPEELKAFQGLDNVSVPIGVLKQYLNMTNQERAGVAKTGVQVDTTDNNELYWWVKNARKADKLVHNKELKIAIKGDSKEEYPTIAKIIKTLQKQKVNKFGLITSLKAATK
ncbi:biopolymer transporter ExbD [Mucilaginibacter corticis]|uniref:Biopolymer transporter ExbD n=1 Tax=Mucilaginibacter corticis TaxID=2597670 RepID=A0A556MWT8_9SPHI|nr:biopolymer transporter ExbD [Mucilaginibacter corticis]TSJ44269.1 biopolymer transporter ExbD [Mucilaginibacter corticis]